MVGFSTVVQEVVEWKPFSERTFSTRSLLKVEWMVTNINFLSGLLPKQNVR